MKRFASLLFATLCLCTATAAQTSGPAKELADSCTKKFTRNDFDGAFADCSKAIELDPKFPDTYLYRGVTLLYLNKDSEAQKDFDKLLEMKPDAKAIMEQAIEMAKRESAPSK